MYGKDRDGPRRLDNQSAFPQGESEREFILISVGSILISQRSRST